MGIWEEPTTSQNKKPHAAHTLAVIPVYSLYISPGSNRCIQHRYSDLRSFDDGSGERQGRSILGMPARGNKCCLASIHADAVAAADDDDDGDIVDGGGG